MTTDKQQREAVLQQLQEFAEERGFMLDLGSNPLQAIKKQSGRSAKEGKEASGVYDPAFVRRSQEEASKGGTRNGQRSGGGGFGKFRTYVAFGAIGVGKNLP